MTISNVSVFRHGVCQILEMQASTLQKIAKKQDTICSFASSLRNALLCSSGFAIFIAQVSLLRLSSRTVLVSSPLSVILHFGFFPRPAAHFGIPHRFFNIPNEIRKETCSQWSEETSNHTHFISVRKKGRFPFPRSDAHF